MLAQLEKLMMEHRWDEARQEALRLLADHPANTQVNAYYGLCEFRLGNFQEALKPFQTAVALDPSFIDAGIKLAQTYDRLHRYHECAVVAKEFLCKRPADHTLQGLLEFHEESLSLDREGWEKHNWMPSKLSKLSNR